MLGHHHHRFITALALTLAAAAPAAAKPIADASPPLIPTVTTASTNPCSEVCSASGYTASLPRIDASAEQGATLPHNPRGRSGALAASTSAGPRSEVVSGGGYASPTTHTTVVRVVAPSNGFDWGDAGIGAAGAVVLMLLILGATRLTPSIRRQASRTAA